MPYDDRESGKPGDPGNPASDPLRGLSRALRHERERLSSVLRAMSEPAWIKDENGVYLVLNDAAARSMGLPEAEILGKTDYDIFAVDYAERVREGDREAIASGASDRLVPMTGVDGADGTLHTIKTPVFDSTGRLVGVFGIARMVQSSAADQPCLMGSDVAVEESTASRYRQIENDLRKARQQIDAIVMRHQSIQEEERKVLSMELHDHLGQAVTGLSVMLEAARRNAAGTSAEQPVIEAMDIVSGLGNTIRNISRRLRPPQLDELGLAAALRWHLDQTGTPFHPRISFSENIGDERLSPALELGCFRVVQEALSNALRHAKAAVVEISLARRGHHLWLSVHDDGVGFDAEATVKNLADLKSLGLLGMRERVLSLGGDFYVDSRPGAGTDVLASFPLT